MRAATDEPGNRFRAVLAGEEIAVVEWSPDLSFGGTLPALSGWAELCELRVHPEWRGRGGGAGLAAGTRPLLRPGGGRPPRVGVPPPGGGGRGHLCTPVTLKNSNPASACIKQKKELDS